MKNSKTAILIFAHSAAFEATQKPFPNAEAVFDLLNKQTLKQVEKTKIPYYLVTEKEQIGHSFETRLAHAIKKTFDLGYQNLILIGNDTPHLTTKHLLLAKQNIDQGKAVIGKSVDGGFYLLGIHKKQFEACSFVDLPWKKQQLSTALHQYLKQKNAVTTHLETLADLDSLFDIEKLFHRFKKLSASLLRLLAQLRLGSKNPVYHSKQTYLFDFLFSLYNKGSPVVA